MDLYTNANYHEYLVIDEEGTIIGSEFVTSHVGIVIRTHLTNNPNDEICPTSSPINNNKANTS